MPEGKVVEFEYGSLPDDHRGKPMSVLHVAGSCAIDLDHDCGGNCACASCHIWVQRGADKIAPMGGDEANMLKKAADLQLNSRLGCQAVITAPGEYVIEIPAWSRNLQAVPEPDK